MSYSHKDSNRVYPVLDALYDKKYRIWYDESCENGNDFRDELRVRIEAADAILVFVSQNSMASPFCGMEIIVARENGKRLYPIYLDNVELPPAFQLLLRIRTTVPQIIWISWSGRWYATCLPQQWIA